MKAILSTKYGPPEVLQFVEVEQPVPLDNQVLVKISAASVNISDWYTMKGGPARFVNGFSKPKDPRRGKDIAGRVEAVGKDVTQFHPGDDVFGFAAGGFAEYTCALEKSLVLKPANISYEQAASVPTSAITALQGLRDTGHIQPGQKVLINGASGGVGTFAVQIAKSFGAEVTAVCGTHHLDTANSIGADHVFDYTKEDFTRSGQQYDLILAVNGYHPLSAYRRVMAPTGTYIFVGASSSHVMRAFIEIAFLGPMISRSGGQKFVSMGIAKINQKDFLVLKDLLQSGKIVPVIDRRYPLSHTADALRYIGEGHVGGKIIITMDTN